jgi:O-antigen/teichoic acid export membrane protein
VTARYQTESPVLPGRKAFAGTFLTSVWIQFLTLITGALTARLLGPHGRGQFAAAQIWPSILATIALLGINNALAIRAAKPSNPVPALERFALRSGIVSAIAVAIVGWFTLRLLLPSDNPVLIPLARLFLIYVPIFVLTSNLMAIDQGSGNFKQFNIARNIITPVYLALLCLLWIFGVRKVEWFLAALLVANFAVLLYRLLLIKPGDSVSPVRMKGLIQSGIPFWITNCVLILRDNAERLLLMFLLGPTSLGLFVVAFTMAGAHMTIAGSLNLVVFSRAAALEKSHALQDAARVFRIMGLVNLVLGFGMVIVQPVIIPLIFGKAFSAAIVPAMLLVAAQLFRSQASVLQEAMRGQARPFIGLVGVLLGMVVFAGIGFWLAHESGIAGVAVASICGQLSYCGFMVFALKRLEPDAQIFIKAEDGTHLIAILRELKSALFNRRIAVKAG